VVSIQLNRTQRTQRDGRNRRNATDVVKTTILCCLLFVVYRFFTYWHFVVFAA